MNKVAIISGASGGLGSYLANSLWQMGYSLGLIIRPSGSLERLGPIFLSNKKNQRIFVYKYDLSDQQSLYDLVGEIKNSFQKIDSLINVAAIHGHIGPAIEANLDEWKKTFSINLDAPMYLSTQLAPMLISGNGGSIINFSGGGATNVRENFSAYASSKIALVKFSEILAAELVHKNVSVNCISPGVLPTNLLEEIVEKGADICGQSEYLMATKMLNNGDQAGFNRVINLVNFLISQDGRRITGKLLSAVWDNWELFPGNEDEILKNQIFTLRRISGKDCKMTWADK